MIKHIDINVLLDAFNIFVVGCLLLSLTRTAWHAGIEKLNFTMRKILIAGIIAFAAHIPPHVRLPFIGRAFSGISLHISILAIYYIYAMVPEYYSEYIRLKMDVSRIFSRAAHITALAGSIIWTAAVPLRLMTDGGRVPDIVRALNWIGQVPGVAVGVISLVLIVRHREALTREERIVFVLYLFIPIIGYMLWFLHPPADMFTTFLTVAFLFAYGEINIKSNRMLGEQAARDRTRALAARLQPDEILGELDRISGLCLTDPEAARDALDEFSTQLRGKVGQINRF